MELRHLRYFEALVDTLNFTRAAEKVHVTQSTLSHQIRQLEDELGMPLFERVGKRVILTESGENFLSNIVPALRQIDFAVKVLKTEKQHLVGEIRIGATHRSNIQIIPRCIAIFAARYPEVRIIVDELSAEIIAERLKEGRLDLGITYRPFADEQLWFESLYNEQMVLLVAATHPLAKHRQIRMVQLHGIRMVLLPKQFSTRKMLDECFEAAGAEPRIIAELNTTEPMFELVRETDIAAIIGATSCPEGNELRVIPLESPMPTRELGLLWKRGAARDSAVKHFAAIVRRLVADAGARASQARQTSGDEKS